MHAWGYKRIVGALKALGHEVSHQTVANVLDRHGVVPAPQRKKKTSWNKFNTYFRRFKGQMSFLILR